MTESSAQTPAPLWEADEAVAATSGALAGRMSWRANGVAIDSRDVAPGDLFIALAGSQSDGHRYIAAALEAGAVAAVSAQPGAALEPPLTEAPLLIVSDTLRALEDLGVAARGRAQALAVIGVTGSVGKTSTKEMLAAMLAPQGATHAPVKSFNNHVGVPLTLARTPRAARFAVIEMGMNNAGEIGPLSRMTQPHVALITAVEAVHTAAFADGVDGVARAKAEIFEGLAPGGVAVLRRDAYFERLRDTALAAGAGEVIDFGADAVMARLLSVETTADATRVTARLRGRELHFEIGAPGRHFAWNALAALAAVDAVGADVDAAAAALRGWRAVAGRGDRGLITLPNGGAILLVDESYNANPASMAAAIETFAAAPVGRRADGRPGRRHVFLTDMLELGSDSAERHAALAAAPSLRAIDLAHAAGAEMRHFFDASPTEKRGLWAADAEALAAKAPSVLEAGDAVMVKGSLGSRARVIAAAIRAMGVKTTGEES